VAAPRTITNITDVGIGATASLIQGEQGRTLMEPSRVRIYANQENVNVSFTITIGADQVASAAVAAIQAAAGVMPIVPDNLLVESFGDGGDEIVIRAQNTDAAASEARVMVQITPIDDVALLRAMENF